MNNPVTRIDEYLETQAKLSLLRFITCGSVDDGKSTLIGRMLYEAQLIFEDQVAALRNESKHHGTQGGDIDFALLVDGLAAEREQGITIDVAYRFFATDHRKFIVADTPGHEQYPATWQPAPLPQTLPSSLLMHRRAYSPKPVAIRSSVHYWASST
jgi:predicted GTPase